jgi:hypothetical protein
MDVTSVNRVSPAPSSERYVTVPTASMSWKAAAT